MRKNSVRKFIHAILDLLPLMVIPIFAIYSQNHEINNNTLQVQENKVVDFNQIYDINTFTLVSGSSQPSYSIQNNEVTFTNGNVSGTYYWLQDSNKYTSVIEGHTYLFKFSINTNTNVSRINIRYNNNYSYDDFVLQTNYEYVLRKNFNTSYNDIRLIMYLTNGTIQTQYTFQYEIFNLTQMFGLGNEPTTNAFLNYYPNNYYEYTLSQRKIINDYIETYDDTDIMSQFVYVTYNAVDKYFNMGNVFNMNGVYDWFVVNIFGGNAPISMFIVWNVVLYEFVMDLLMLLYGLFMWFIDMIEKLMNKPLDSIK